MVKIQGNIENTLTDDEKYSAQIFLKGGINEEPEVNSTSFVQSTLQAAQLKNSVHKQYNSTKHVSPTSNLCERLFSRASLILTPNRRSMDPETAETIIMLRFNKDLWDAEFVQQCIVRNSNTAPPTEEANGNTTTTTTSGNTTTTTTSGSKRPIEEISIDHSDIEFSINDQYDDDDDIFIDE